MESSSSSTLSSPPSYPGLHSVALLQPKSPGSHSAREDAATWNMWHSEIQDLVDFLLTEPPPPSKSSTKRSSRELLRSGSKHLRQSLRGGPLRNTWGSRQLRTLMGKPEQRFCHIVQDPEFLKDMADPGMYLINCNARALNKGIQERQSKGSLDWKAVRISELSRDTDPDATLCGIPDSPRVPRVLSKRFPLSSHPSRGHASGTTAMGDKSRQTSTLVHRPPTPRMQGAMSPRLDANEILPEVPTTTFDPFAMVAVDSSSVTRKPIRIDPPRVVTSETPLPSVIHLLPAQKTPDVVNLCEQDALPGTSTQDSPSSSRTTPFLSEKGSYEDGFPLPLKDEPLTAPNKPWLEGGFTPGQPRHVQSNDKTPPTRIPAPSSSPEPQTTTSSSDTKHRYATTQNVWSANAALARRRMASRVDATRRLKQRDFERARAVRERTVSDASIQATKSIASSTDEKPPGSSHSAHSESDDRDMPAIPLPRTVRLQRAISLDGPEEPEPVTSRALDWYATSPPTQPHPGMVSTTPPASRCALSPILTVAERAPSPVRPTKRPARARTERTMYRSRAIQCCIGTDDEARDGAESVNNSSKATTTATTEACSSPDLTRLETKLDAQLAQMNQRTKTLESLLLAFMQRAAPPARETSRLGWDAWGPTAAAAPSGELDGFSVGAASLGAINETAAAAGLV